MMFPPRQGFVANVGTAHRSRACPTSAFKSVEIGNSRFRMSAPLPTLHLRLLRDRHRGAGDLEVDRAQVHATCKEQRLPIVAAEAEVRGCGLAVDDAAEFLACGIEGVEPARAAAIDI